MYALIALVGANFIYQVIRKPTELFFPISGALYKTPEETWRVYAGLFRRYATPHVSAPLLAALAPVEGSGNPLVRTYWHWASPAPVMKLAEIAVTPSTSDATIATVTDVARACGKNPIVKDNPLAWGLREPRLPR